MDDLRTKVDKLPVLNQENFPQFPKLLPGMKLFISNSNLRNMEKEAVLAAVITVASRNNKWCPVKSEDFVKAIDATQLFFMQQILDAIVLLKVAGLIHLITYQCEDYIVPTPEFAEAINEANLNYIS